MKIFILATLLGTASAFAPSQNASPFATRGTALSESEVIAESDVVAEVETADDAPAVSTAPVIANGGVASLSLIKSKYANEVGAQAPLGYWDPLSILQMKNTEEESDAQFAWWREAEIKHGRISMLAVVGYIATYTGLRLPGMENVPYGLGAFDGSLYERGGLAETNLWITVTTVLFLECVVRDVTETGKHPGDYLNGFGEQRWDFRSDEVKKNQRAKELNNGRAAMMGILGLVVHENMGNVDDLLGFLK